MNCIIIEDEHNAADHLEARLLQSGHDITVIARLDSIEEAVPWLQENTADLIFMDIQLGDGLSFEIFDHVQVKTPIIFTTSYDKYIIKSFELNSLAYLLKPINMEELDHALKKYTFLYEGEGTVNDRTLDLHENNYQKRFLVRTGSIFQSIHLNDIAFFHLQNKRYLFINTHDRKQYLYDSTMDYLEKRLDPGLFFRINRQFIIHHSCVEKMTPQERGKLKLDIPGSKEEMVVSSSRAQDFKKWLDR